MARGSPQIGPVLKLLNNTYVANVTVLYSAPPIPAGIRSFQWNSGGIPVESTGIPVESCRNPVIPVEFQWNPQESTGIPLEFHWNQAD